VFILIGKLVDCGWKPSLKGKQLLIKDRLASRKLYYWTIHLRKDIRPE